MTGEEGKTQGSLLGSTTAAAAAQGEETG